MISIITAVYNQLDMNRLFWEYLVKYTESPFELIIIDNGSTDGSREFFQSLPKEIVKVIANDGNYSYPHCQNQGISSAKYDIFVFLNNDLLLSKHWDKRLLEILGKDKRELLSLASNDRLYNKTETQKISRKWKRIKYPLMFLFGQKRFSLKLMHKLCYWNWEKYTEKIFKKYGFSHTVGFSGSAIAATRHAMETLKMWDITQQHADFNLFYTSCFYAEENDDMEAMSIVNGIFIHHFQRLTLHGENLTWRSEKYPPFKDREKLKNIDFNWSSEQTKRWIKYFKEF